MGKEIEALKINKTWTIEHFPPGKKPINYKWVYRVKYNSDGSINDTRQDLLFEENNG